MHSLLIESIFFSCSSEGGSAQTSLTSFSLEDELCFDEVVTSSEGSIRSFIISFLGEEKNNWICSLTLFGRNSYCKVVLIDSSFCTLKLCTFLQERTETAFEERSDVD